MLGREFSRIKKMSYISVIAKFTMFIIMKRIQYAYFQENLLNKLEDGTNILMCENSLPAYDVRDHLLYISNKLKYFKNKVKHGKVV